MLLLIYACCLRDYSNVEEKDLLHIEPYGAPDGGGSLGNYSGRPGLRADLVIADIMDFSRGECPCGTNGEWEVAATTATGVCSGVRGIEQQTHLGIFRGYCDRPILV